MPHSVMECTLLCPSVVHSHQLNQLWFLHRRRRLRRRGGGKGIRGIHRRLLHRLHLRLLLHRLHLRRLLHLHHRRSCFRRRRRRHWHRLLCCHHRGLLCLRHHRLLCWRLRKRLLRKRVWFLRERIGAYGGSTTTLRVLASHDWSFWPRTSTSERTEPVVSRSVS